MRIAILGTGNVGTTLARGLSALGHDIVLGSRDPSAKPDLPVAALPAAEAVADADLVVNALPGAVALDALRALPAGSLDGRIVLDVSNQIGAGMQLVYPNDSIGRRIQEAFPAAKVVKSLSTFAAQLMVDPGSLSAPTTVFLSGDDAAAKATVSELLASLGWAPESQVDLGGIDTAKGPEHYLLLFVSLRGAVEAPYFNVAIVS